MMKVDFKAACKARYAAIPKEGEKDGPNSDAESFRQFLLKLRRTASGEAYEDDLVLAVWLHRLGEDELAARALAVARAGRDDPRKRLRDELAWSAFAGLIHAYMVRADVEALGH